MIEFGHRSVDVRNSCRA